MGKTYEIKCKMLVDLFKIYAYSILELGSGADEGGKEGQLPPTKRFQLLV